MLRDPAAPVQANPCLTPLAACDGPRLYVYSVRWSPRDDYVLAATNDELRLLHVDTRAGTLREVAQFTKQQTVGSADWSPDGAFALSASDDVALLEVTRDPPGFIERARYAGKTREVHSVRWSPDGRHALIAARDGSVRLLAIDAERRSLRERARFSASSSKAFGVAWAPDGRHALTIGEDGTAQLVAIDLDPPAIRQRDVLRDEGWQSAVSWARGDLPPLVGTWGSQNLVKPIAVELGAGKLRVVEELAWHTSGLDVLEWAPHDSMLASAGHDDTVRLSRYVQGRFEEVATLPDDGAGVHSVSWSPDGAHIILAASHHDQVRLVDTRACAAQGSVPATP